MNGLWRNVSNEKWDRRHGQPLSKFKKLNKILANSVRRWIKKGNIETQELVEPTLNHVTSLLQSYY